MSELGPDARSILDAARARERPTDADRARVRRTLMRAMAAGGAAAAATTAGTGAAKGAGAAAATTVVGSGAVSVAGKVVAALVLVGAVGAGAASVASKQGAPADARPAAAPLEVPAQVTAAPPPAEPAVMAPPPDPPAPAKAPVVSRAQPHASAAPFQLEGEAAAAEDPLDVETRGLGEAHRALQSGDAQRALSLLEQQSAAHAQGELREERAAARVVALCKLERTAEARVVAETFLRENPRSLLADRVRAACPSSPSR